MPAWTTPKTWQTGEALTASDMNAHIRDNLDHLHTRMENYDQYTGDETSDYTTTSTSFVDVDSTNLAVTITTTKDNALVLVHFHGAVSEGATARFCFDVAVDGTRVGGDNGITGCKPSTAGYEIPVSFTRLIVVPAAGAHTFKLQWVVEGNTVTLYAGTGAAHVDYEPQFWAKEL